MPVPYLYHLERLKVDRFPLFWLSRDAANTTYCHNFSSNSSRSSSSSGSSSGVVVVVVVVVVVLVFV